jgi:hypothetical protein
VPLKLTSIFLPYLVMQWTQMVVLDVEPEMRAGKRRTSHTAKTQIDSGQDIKVCSVEYNGQATIRFIHFVHNRKALWKIIYASTTFGRRMLSFNRCMVVKMFIVATSACFKVEAVRWCLFLTNICIVEPIGHQFHIPVGFKPHSTSNGTCNFLAFFLILLTFYLMETCADGLNR